jgi:dolichol-phosphate mannosyltransferase
VIKLTRNFGQVNALWCGLSHARGRFVAAMSADGQDPADLVNQMLRAHVEEAYDVVICARQERDESTYRVATSRVFYWLMRKLSFPEMPAGGFDVVSMSRRALDVFLSVRESHAFFQGQILWMGFAPKVITYRRAVRQGGRSRWTFRRKLTYLIDGVLSYSYTPLRLMSVLGLVLALCGFAYAMLVAVLRLAGVLPQVGILTPLLVVVLVLGGTQMIMVGVIGEYIWRTLAQVRSRPLYVIDRVYDAESMAGWPAAGAWSHGPAHRPPPRAASEADPGRMP